MIRICHDFRDGIFFHTDGRVTVVGKDGSGMGFESFEKYMEFRQMVIEMTPKIQENCKKLIKQLRENHKKIMKKEEA